MPMNRTGRWMRRALLLPAMAASLCMSGPGHARSAPVSDEAMFDRIRIEDMMTDYYVLLTQKERHDIGEYFAEDAVIDANGTLFEGRQAIQDLYDNATDTRVIEGNIYNMLIGNPRIRVDGDEAVMDAVWTGYLSDNIYTAPRLLEQGTEHTTFRKRNGVWMITRRTITNQGGTPLWLTGEN